ncbi:enoyl-CoA hydratase [Sapientia aquatica]|uniref:Enoyl-CoA hydratase n=2 Tax=Sapientia aquatica TaxID=1549640 RepID=A0A4R5W1D9_9BURK|nr:enoyl-CoA hydratase [Sapientia aquatica]
MNVLCEYEDDIAIVILNNPTKLNPLSSDTLCQLRAALADIRNKKSVRAVILTGSGKAFCSGFNLSAKSAADDPQGRSLGNQIADSMLMTSDPLILELHEFPIPVVCALNGAAVGGGVGLALAADIVVAARSSYFYLSSIPRLGIVPDLGSTWFLSRLIGRARATAITLLGHRLPAEQAAQWGMVWLCVDDADLMTKARSIAHQLGALPVHGVIEARRAFDAADKNNLAKQLDYERGRQRELIDLPSFAQGVQAFIEKRVPVFS